ncbi:MAG: hypothetical protein L3J98_12690, partial [Gammaproteobacteria bacterium]|nr:hypothetical protein [Gammaproteobacteria bacterium]MCF6260994.1 hypothetical protein [Gammaproteobacteria bacterium]
LQLMSLMRVPGVKVTFCGTVRAPGSVFGLLSLSQALSSTTLSNIRKKRQWEMNETGDETEK